MSSTKANYINLYRCLNVQKHWPWQEKFDKFLIMIAGFGLQHKWAFDYISNFIVVDHGETKETVGERTPLSLEHLYSGCLIYAIGLFCSILVFTLKETRMHVKNETVSKLERAPNKWAPVRLGYKRND